WLHPHPRRIAERADGGALALGQRGQAVAFVAGGLQSDRLALAAKNALQALQRPMLNRLHRALGAAQQPGYLAVAHIREEAQRHYLLLIVGELLDRLLEHDPIRDQTKAGLALQIDDIVLGVEGGGDDAATAAVAVEE